MIDDSQLTRRRLLAFGGAAVATAALPGTARAARRAAPPSWSDREALASRVGDTFVMQGEEGSVSVRLQSVLDLSGTTPRGRSLKRHANAYVLTFQPLSGTPSGQATRTFSHRQLGSTQLFAVAGDVTYTVVVNRSVSLGTANRWSAAAVRMNKKRRKRARRR